MSLAVIGVVDPFVTVIAGLCAWIFVASEDKRGVKSFVAIRASGAEDENESFVAVGASDAEYEDELFVAVGGCDDE